MATSGVNYTGKWELSDDVLTLSPVSGNSGIFRGGNHYHHLHEFVDLTLEEWKSVREIVFSSSVSFQVKDFFGSNYNPLDRFSQFFTYFEGYSPTYLDIISIDVTGLDTSGSISMASMFNVFTLREIIGLEHLNVSQVTDFSSMFQGADITSLDLSSFDVTALNNADIGAMLVDLDYCTTITFPIGFQRTSPSDWTTSFGIARNSHDPITATKDGVTIASDNDFFKLTATSQDGTWTRDVSGSAPLLFVAYNAERNGTQGNIKYRYSSVSATVEVYLKTVEQSSFPLTPSETFSISGSGSDILTVTLASDSAYDVMIKVFDSTTTLYLYPSIDSNVLLFSIDDDGNVKAQGWAGFVQMFAGATAPSGWLFCDGSEVAVADYPLLYAVIGNTYGTPSDSGHFVLPDFMGRTPVGAGQGTGLSNRTRGQKVGAETHKLTVNEMPSHRHKEVNIPWFQSNRTMSSGAYTLADIKTSNVYTEYTGGDQEHNNMQPSLGINFIICTGETS